MKTLLLILFAFIVSQGVAQKKWDKKIAKAEAQYDKGEMVKAISRMNKFNKQSTKKLGADNRYVPLYHLRIAKYNLGAGLLRNYEVRLEAALAKSASIHHVGSFQDAMIKLEAAGLCFENGSYNFGRELLAKSKAAIDTSKLSTPLMKSRWNLAMAEGLSGQGFFNEATEMIQKEEKFLIGRAVRKVAAASPQGGLKIVQLPKAEVRQRFSDYARYLTLYVDNKGRQGYQISADSAYAIAIHWIDDNLGNLSIESVRLRYLMATILMDHGTPMVAELEPEEIKQNWVKKHRLYHPMGVDVYQLYLLDLLSRNQIPEYMRIYDIYMSTLVQHTEGHSIFRLRASILNFDPKLRKVNNLDLKSQGSGILVNLKTFPKNRATLSLLDFLCEEDTHQKQYDVAEKYRNEIIELKTALYGPVAPETHLEKVRQANFYLDYTNRIPEAEKIYKESFTGIVEKEIGPWHKDQLDILNHVAALNELLDSYATASALLDKGSAVAYSKYSNKDYKYADELTKIAKLQLRIGEYDKADVNLVKALTILEEFRKEEDKKIYLINALQTQAVLFGIKGMFPEAEDNLSRSRKIAKRTDEWVGLDNLNTVKELSSLYIQLGRYAQTEAALPGLVSEYEKLYGANSLRLIEPLVNQGKLSLAKGDYTQAEKTAHRANDIALNVYGEKSTKTAATQLLLCDIYYALGDYFPAELNIDLALASQKKQFKNDHIDVAKSLAKKALIEFYKGGDRKEVEKLLLESRDIMARKLGKENPQYADILKSVAILYISQKRFDNAFSALTQAEKIWAAKDSTKTNINLAEIYTLTGDTFYEQKRYDRADVFYKKSKRLYEKFFSVTHPEYIKVQSRQAKVYYMQKEYRKAKRNIEEVLETYNVFIKKYFPALSENQKAKYWNTIKPDFEFYNTLAFGKIDEFRDLSGKVYNYQLLTKALLLSSSIKVRQRILSSTDEPLKKAYNDWVQKNETLSRALSMSNDQLNENGINKNAMAGEVESLEKELSEKSEIFGKSFEDKKVTYENVQKSLAKNEVALEIVRFRHFDHTFTDSIIYVALYVRNDNARPVAIPLTDGRRLENRYFNYYRNCIKGMVADSISFHVFWEPIQKKVGNYSTIFLSPDGVYNQINLESLSTPDGKYMIDNSNILLVSNTKDIYTRKLKAREFNSTKSASLFGNPSFYLTASTKNTIPSLPGTEAEVQELQALLNKSGWKSDKYLDANATEDYVKSVESPRIFHIATHGFYSPTETTPGELTESEAAQNDNPLLKSGLLLKGAGDLLDKAKKNYNLESGILTAYEAMNLNLDKTDLVVLSACETGLGQVAYGEGVYGLQRAFLVAGAKILIMSMFKVDDEATQKLILNFYRKWLITGKLRQSFIDAKKELRVEYPQPIYWSAFIMIGVE